MKHGSLFSGIGGFDLAAQWMGWENVFHCEINSFGRQILNYYWPKAEHYADVFEFDGTRWRRKVDIITCGFPCQPFSHAGKRKGSKDDRFIWPENMRIFREAQPAFIVAENVPGLLTIEDGMVFEQACADLENEGYEVTPLIIPAVATDKDHRRDRVWIVAYNDKFNVHNGRSQGPDFKLPNIQHQRSDSNASNITSGGVGQDNRQGKSRLNHEAIKEHWLEAATRLCSMDDGIPPGLDTKAISKARWRKESIMALGNSIVWEIAYEIFKAIEQHELLRREGE